jgi:hypothetical protein
LVIMDYCTVRTIMTRAGKTFPPGLGWKIREFSAWPNGFCVPRHVWILQGRSIKREEWDKRRAFGYHDDIYKVVPRSIPVKSLPEASWSYSSFTTGVSTLYVPPKFVRTEGRRNGKRRGIEKGRYGFTQSRWAVWK